MAFGCQCKNINTNSSRDSPRRSCGVDFVSAETISADAACTIAASSRSQTTAAASDGCSWIAPGRSTEFRSPRTGPASPGFPPSARMGSCWLGERRRAWSWLPTSKRCANGCPHCDGDAVKPQAWHEFNSICAGGTENIPARDTLSKPSGWRPAFPAMPARTYVPRSARGLPAPRSGRNGRSRLWPRL
jgi:hypothetical protein